MAVDLKTGWTNEQLAMLMASVEDDRDWRLEVSAAGVADLFDKTAHGLPFLRFLRASVRRMPLIIGVSRTNTHTRG